MGGSFGAGATPGAMNPQMFDPQAMNGWLSSCRRCGRQNSADPEAARQATLDVLRAHGYPIPANVPSGPVVLQIGDAGDRRAGRARFRTPRCNGTGAGIAEAILAADAQAGVPSQPAAPGDATGRLQELDALKAQGVVNDAEYAAQRQRILDSI